MISIVSFGNPISPYFLEITEETVWEDDYADLEFWHYKKESSSMTLLLKTDIKEMPKDYRAEFENTMMRIDTGQMPMPYEDGLSEEENENNRKHVLGVANSLQKFAKTHSGHLSCESNIIVLTKTVVMMMPVPLAKFHLPVPASNGFGFN